MRHCSMLNLGKMKHERENAETQQAEISHRAEALFSCAFLPLAIIFSAAASVGALLGLTPRAYSANTFVGYARVSALAPDYVRDG